ncbi:MAG: glycosyltransferase [Pirellulales bacterium]
MNRHELDIVVPVYNEGENLLALVESLRRCMRTPYRLLVCYDRDDDETLPVVARLASELEIVAVKNEGQGVLNAILTGFRRSTAPAVLVIPADDTFNAPRLDAMAARVAAGIDVVCPSRFMAGGCMVGCAWPKSMLVRVAASFLWRIAAVPCHDPTNGFRFFSRRVVEQIPVETQAGFAFSLELLVKCHRLGWSIEEYPAEWYERQVGRSRFRILRWAPSYLRWVAYAMGTRFLGRGPQTVVLRDCNAGKDA